jgi:hypothetical protein
MTLSQLDDLAMVAGEISPIENIDAEAPNSSPKF